jgi:hypothetical protein
MQDTEQIAFSSASKKLFHRNPHNLISLDLQDCSCGTPRLSLGPMGINEKHEYFETCQTRGPGGRGYRLQDRHTKYLAQGGRRDSS